MFDQYSPEGSDRQSPMRYLRVTLTDRHAFYLQVTSESAGFITGREVDKDGAEVAGKGFDLRVRVIDKQAIRRMAEVRMNLFYGQLEPANS